MNAYQRGTAINLRQKFWLIDPLTEVKTLADPTHVVFTIKSPQEGAPDLVYTFGVDGNVTHPSVGIFICELDPLLPVGTYYYRCDGTGAVKASSEDWFEVIDSAILPPEKPNVPVLGPCFGWISGQDVAACARQDYTGDNGYLFDTVAYEASMALYEISGRRFVGTCERTVRPTATECACWFSGPYSFGFGPVWWTGTPWGFAGSWGWRNERGDRFGCSPMSRVRLAGYPVKKITEVLIDGVVLPELDGQGVRNWRLDKWRDLIRMDSPPDPGTGLPAEPRFWPGCQNMSLDPDQPGTFQIKYQWGEDPPQLGRDAAIEVAQQLWLTCNGQECVLPAGVTRINRQGVEVERQLLANWADPKKATGLVHVDLFLQAYASGERRGRRTAVWSPDIQGYARSVGT